MGLGATKRMSNNLVNRSVLVTGGGSGIGEAIARGSAARGAIVIVADISEAAARAVADDICAAGGRAIAKILDVTDPSSQRECVDDIVARFGSLNAVVNNAGVAGPQKILDQIDEREWQDVLRINLDGVFLGMKYQAPAMVRSGGGAIVNNASMFGLVARTSMAAYIASKHGVIGLTKAAALDYAGTGLRINAVAPGVIDTPLLRANADAPEADRLQALHPIGRLGTPDDVSNVVNFLISDEAAFVTGAVFSVDGAYTAQ